MDAGKFWLHDQHIKDTANYFDIHLEIIPVWTDRKDGFWFYVEQAAADHMDKPYRQRIYHLTVPRPGVFESRIFQFNDPLRFAQQPQLVEKLNSDSIFEKNGCSALLHKTNENTFQGATKDKNCPSERKG